MEERGRSSVLHGLTSQTTMIFREMRVSRYSVAMNEVGFNCLSCEMSNSYDSLKHRQRHSAKRPRAVLIFLTRGNAAHDSIVPPRLWRSRWVRLIVFNKRRHEIGTKLSESIPTFINTFSLLSLLKKK
jgi:hypothetical protein